MALRYPEMVARTLGDITREWRELEGNDEQHWLAVSGRDVVKSRRFQNKLSPRHAGRIGSMRGRVW